MRCGVRGDRNRRRTRSRLLDVAIVLCLGAGLIGLIGAVAFGQGNPLNDLFALGQGGGETPPAVAVEKRAEPPFAATPLAKCGPGSHEQPGVDGRVPEGSAKDGLNCNLKMVAHQGTEGGFRTYRYIDSQGHECAFYDSTLLFPLNALNPGAGSVG